MTNSIKERLHIHDNTSEIKTLIFDFGGVLIDLDKERSIENFKKLGVEGIDELLSFWCQKGFFLLFEEGKISTREFLDEIKKMSTRNISDEDIKTAFFSFLVDLPRYKLELIARLRPHYQIFLLSNINELIYNYCLEKYFHAYHTKIENYFDKIYLSFQMNVCKPKKEIYQQLIQDSGIIPEETLFLEDGSENVAVAQSMGINTFLALPQEDFTPLFDIPLLKP